MPAEDESKPVKAPKHLRAAEMVGELDQRCGGDDLHFGAGPGRFGAAGGEQMRPSPRALAPIVRPAARRQPRRSSRRGRVRQAPPTTSIPSLEKRKLVSAAPRKTRRTYVQGRG